MTPNGLKVADSDMHVLEPPDLWQRYIDPAWRHAAPVGLTEMRARHAGPGEVARHAAHRAAAAGERRRVRAWSAEQNRVFAAAEARGWDAHSQLDAMDSEGLDLAVLFPSRGLFVLGLDTPQMIGTDGLEPEFAAAIARAYNDWLRDFCKEDPKRLFGAGDGGAARRATPRSRRRGAASSELGFKAVFLAPGCVEPPSVARSRTTIRCGPSASASTSRSASTAAARRSSAPTSRSRCSTSS